MTPEAQRIAIAKACGWVADKTPDSQGNYWLRHKGQIVGGNCEPAVLSHLLPDYLNDLNACHEIEKLLTFNQAAAYEQELKAAQLRAAKTGFCPPPSYHIKAQHRAEAFLKAISQWVE